MKRIRSTYSGVLEISYHRGQKVLDSRNTSYSYGNLQRVWDKAIQEVPFAAAARLLILGMGGGSTIELLRKKYGYTGNITAIELDPVIVRIAAEEFSIRPDKNLRIFCMDATAYVHKRKKPFNLILIDLFIDRHVPEPVLQYDFWKGTAQTTAPGGWILFNAFADDERLTEIRAWLMEHGFRHTFLKKINGANTLLYAQKN